MKRFLFLTVFFLFFFLFSSPALATEPEFYVGLYGHNFDYFEKSGFNAVILQYTRDRFENLDPNKGKERVDQFIKDFAKKPSYRIILDWAFFPKDAEKGGMCVKLPPKNPGDPDEPVVDEAWWADKLAVNKAMLDYHHNQGSLPYVWGITLSEETWYCPKNLERMYNETRQYLNFLGYGKNDAHYVRVLQWPGHPKWSGQAWVPYLTNLPADGYVKDDYFRKAEIENSNADVAYEIAQYKKTGKPFVLIPAHPTCCSEDTGIICRQGTNYICNKDQAELVYSLFQKEGYPDTLIFYPFGYDCSLYKNCWFGIWPQHPADPRFQEEIGYWKWVLEWSKDKASCCFSNWADMDFNGKVNQKDLKLMARYFYGDIDLIGDGNQDYFLNSLDFAKAKNLIGQ